jgi:peptide/nickel transport system substrate-binding protein
MIDRRRFVALTGGLAASVAAPALLKAADARVLKFVPQANLTALDPIWTTAGITTTHGYTVFDTLYGLDERGVVQPQMAEGHTVSDDGRVWTIKLRAGLRWHDGQAVTARDCIASIQRWSKRDPFGQSLAHVVEDWSSPDERTIRIGLGSPFPLLHAALAKISAAAFMMPEHLANTDPFKQIPEVVGSGPYKFIAGDYVSGSRAAYERFTGYVPRNEPPSNTAGGKVAYFDRVEWIVMPDAATATAALQAGEVDWLDQVSPDLSPLLANSPKVKVGVNDPGGYVGTLRFNALNPPFDKAVLRRAVLLAVNQADYLQAITGNRPELYSECHSVWPCGTAYGAETGPAKADLDAAKALLNQGGYNGEKVVIINPSDLPSIGPFGEVTFDLLKKLGMNVDLQNTDWGSVVQRRASREPVEKGGWSIFHTWWPCTSISNPAINPTLRGQGSGGWFGWYKDDKVEALTAAWLLAAGAEEQTKLAAAIQDESFNEVPIVPLGRYFIETAYRADLTGFVRSGMSLPWSVRRA